jgi:arylsulfatase A-like enzyme
MGSALQIIAAEDPDVLFVLPGCVDYAQHHTGTADRPAEWGPGPNPDLLWDDFNLYNRHANREPVLDTIHEADDLFGLFVEALQARGTYDASLVVLASDHGQCTFMNESLNLEEILDDAGVPSEAVAWHVAIGDIAFVWLSAPSFSGAVESALEAFAVTHPIFQEEVHPLLVMNREEMDTGVDGVVGRIAADGGPQHGELYSHWYIDCEGDGDEPRPVWPDLLVFSRYRYQLQYVAPLPLQTGSHGGPGWEQRVPLAVRGPGVGKGVYEGTEATLVDVAPTLYHLLGWTAPPHVDGRVLDEILPEP